MEKNSVDILWDNQHSIPLQYALDEDDLIVLLTPVIVPLDRAAEPQDPFEPLGRAIAARHPLVRHVPYTKRGGITGTHSAFINRCKIVLFVISGPPCDDDEPSQADYADTVALIAVDRLQIILACCSVQDCDISAERFSTVMQVNDLRPAALQEAAAALFSETKTPSLEESRPASPMDTTMDDAPPPPLLPENWPVGGWELNRDLEAIHELWAECLPRRFQLPRGILSSLLKRDGYAMHYVVHDPHTKKLVGFCATYTTYPDSSPVRLVGSLAALLVKPSHRRRGIGQALHDIALSQLQKTRGVDLLQLGSSFPRLLYGVPNDPEAEDWFMARGWRLGQGLPRQLGDASDWFIRLEGAPDKSLSTAGLTFRMCTLQDNYKRILAAIDRDTIRKSNLGWYDQYARLDGTCHLEDVILGFEGEILVSAAILYTPTSGSLVVEDVPWASTLGDHVGGVACICIIDDNPEVVNNRDSISVRLLHTCARLLAKKGMKYMFLDGVRGGEGSFKHTGFERWARYKEAWRKL